jgi:hypothetical protein
MAVIAVARGVAALAGMVVEVTAAATALPMAPTELFEN